MAKLFGVSRSTIYRYLPELSGGSRVELLAGESASVIETPAEEADTKLA
ncbi:helix-turn-helix domain-containing protein [Kribbella turkmenica]